MLDIYKKVATKLVALKSVSMDSSFKEECKKTAEFLVELLQSYGVDAKTMPTIDNGNPVVFGSYIVDPKAETCLIYGHYDVQPASKEDGWDSDPFTLTEKDDRFYGRGIMDDKCQFLIHILTIGKLIKEKKLRYNVKFLFEGEEEIGSKHIEPFIEANKELLSCDFIFFSDDEMVHGKPTVELSTRGIVNATLTIKTSTNEVHSGIFGGAIPVATHELSKFISGLFDENQHLTIEGFYDDVDPIDGSYRIPFDLEAFRQNTGAKNVHTEKGYDFYTQTGLLPAVTITGMYGGYIQEGHKSIVPSSATAKLNFRIVKSQKPEKVIALIKKHVEKVMPDYVDYEISFSEMSYPVKTEKENEYVQRAIEVLRAVFGEDPLYKFVGGTEPILLFFQEILKKPIVAIPFANEDGHMHGINENFTIKNIEKGFEFSNAFFGK